MKINWTVTPPQTRSTLNGPIERQIDAVQNDFSYPTLELDITPELARHWLEWNECIRRRSPAAVRTLVHAINVGKFPFVGDPIRLGELDKKTLRRPLRDGQHRLAAIIASGKPVRAFVIFDFPQDLFAYVDSGKPRKAKDFLNLPYNIASLVGGAARYVYFFERKSDGFAWMGGAKTNAISAEYLETFERHPAIETWATEARQTKQMSIGAIVATSYWISSTKDIRADEFLTKLYDPSGLNVTDLLYQLGEKIRWERKRYFALPDGRRMMVWAIFRAWELFKNAETRKFIRLTGGEISWPGGAPYLTENGDRPPLAILTHPGG